MPKGTSRGKAKARAKKATSGARGKTRGGAGPLQLRKIMSKRVVKAKPELTLQEAARMMKRHAIGCLVVEEQGRLVGILTERDIIAAVAEGKDPGQARVEALMSQPVVCAATDVDIAAAAQLMVQHGIKKLPLMDEEGHVAGIVTFTDFATVLPAFQEAFAHAMRGAGQEARGRFARHVPHAPWTFI